MCEGVEFKDVGAMMANDDVDYQLPSHHRCACHSLNLVSTTDAQRAERSVAYNLQASVAGGLCQVSCTVEQDWPFSPGF